MKRWTYVISGQLIFLALESYLGSKFPKIRPMFLSTYRNQVQLINDRWDEIYRAYKESK